MSEQAVMEPPAKGKTAQERNAEYNESVSRTDAKVRLLHQHAESADVYRVGYVNGKTTIKYSIIEDNRNNDLLLATDSEPCEAFKNALHSLSPHVSRLLNRLEAEQTRQATQMTVKAVIFSYKDNGNTHAQIVVSRQLDSGQCFTFTTPSMPIESDDPAVSSLKGSSDGIETSLYALIDEAKAYIGGKRAQGVLAFPDADESEWGDGDGDDGDDDEGADGE